MRPVTILEDLILCLPLIANHHQPGTRLYKLLQEVARREVEASFSAEDLSPQEFGPFGKIVFPFYSMGTINSLNLFGLDELIILSFYWLNRQKYRRALDAGANIGLHSIAMSRCGFEVKAYEPDPQHFEVLHRNLQSNGCLGVHAFNSALSVRAGDLEFVRVLDNTTGSHIAGSKPNPYGPLERFPVKADEARPLFQWADLVKLDVEGHEKDILLDTVADDWSNTDALVEVGNEENARLIFEHFQSMGARMFSQKTNWGEVNELEHMPTSHREGTLFLTSKAEMPWS